MRAIVRGFIIGRPEIVELIPADRWFEGGAVIDTPTKPFGVLKFGGTFRGMGPVRVNRLEVVVHAERGSFDLIDTVLLRSKLAFADAVHLRRAGSDVEVMQVDWVSDSPDLFDAEHRSNTRSSQYDLIAKGV